jgi:DNA primase
MPRIAPADLERLKNEISVQRLVEASGVALKKSGKDWLGKCPFHDDGEPSLVVTPVKNLWHCFGCQVGGGPIDWVIKTRGVSFRHAVELLNDGSFLAAKDENCAPSVTPITRSTVRTLAMPVSLNADDQRLLDETAQYYHERLKQSTEGLAYLQSRGLNHPELIDTFKLGLADRTLGLRLPEKNRKAGADIRARLQAIGLLRESGHEHFNGSVVIPIRNAHGHVVEMYGRKVRDDLRVGTPKHLYLPGPHAGIFNAVALGASTEIILCEALIDALTFWCAGYRNVTSSFGIEGFTDELLAAFKTHSTERVLIAYDRDEAGERAAQKLAERLMAQGIECYRVQFPKGMDANEVALKMQPADKALGVLLRKAVWLGGGAKSARQNGSTQAPIHLVASEENPPLPALSLAAKNGAHESLAAKEKNSGKTAEKATEKAAENTTAPEQLAHIIAAPLPASPLPTMSPASSETAAPSGTSDADLILQFEARRYRVRGWQKPLNPEALKINLLASCGERFHVDTLDLYSAKARAAFIKLAGIELGESEETLKHDLGRVLLKLEALQSEQLKAVLKKDDQAPSLTSQEHAAALDLLTDPKLLERIAVDFAALGVVGEKTNTLMGYIAVVSRLLERPLAVIIQSSSAAGKSSLMDAVLSLVPAQAQVRYSAMTGQSLFYMGQTSLKNKILAIAEEEGASNAGYALKLLQSDGQVTMASTGKDPNTGLLVTHEYKVEGPVMLFLTTTAIDIDEELMNRCIVLTVNESREQTRAIHALQRKRQTLEGLLLSAGKQAIQALHQNAQRLLQPLAVVNPFAEQLTFLDEKTRTRRDHMKYLSLIHAITLLHQYQREVKAIEHRGQWLKYIEVTRQDIALANQLAHETLGRTLDELPPQTRRLLGLIYAWVKAQAQSQGIAQKELRFTRKEVRELSGWGDTQCRVHLERLVQMEYLMVSSGHKGRRGQVFEYELLYQGEAEHTGEHGQGNKFLMGLLDLETLGLENPAPEKATITTQSSRGVEPQFAGQGETQAGLLRPENGANAAGLRVEQMTGLPRQDAELDEIQADALQNALVTKTNGAVLSYPSLVASVVDANTLGAANTLAALA